jgi:ubiquinone/menaquinone biosynthesis C-methylase UbiE
MKRNLISLKEAVTQYWEQEVCGTRYGKSYCNKKLYFQEISAQRYRLEGYIQDFAQFSEWRGKKILEIGLGTGSDFHKWIIHGAKATGIDITNSSVRLTKERLEIYNIKPEEYTLSIADAEMMPFRNNEFDLIYSYGVLHHTPDTCLALSEIFRALKPGGMFKAMIYHVPSWTGWLLWLQHALLKGKIGLSVKEVISSNLESPGTKAFTCKETNDLLQSVGFEYIKLTVKLSPSDLLIIKPSRKYQKPFYKMLWIFYPRWIIRFFGDCYGLTLLISAKKSNNCRS